MNYKQLQSFSFFQDLTHDKLKKLVGCLTLKNYSKGQLIFSYEELNKYSYIINSGWVKLFRITLDGQESLIGLSTIGDLIGQADLDHEVHLFNAQAVDQVEAYLLPHEILCELVKEDANLAMRYIKALNNSLSTVNLHLEHISTMNAAQRIACFILRLCGERKSPLQISFPFDKNLVASYLKMKFETFSRALKDLRLFGVKVNGRIVMIENIQKLIDFCCVSCSLSFDTCREKF